MTSAGIVALLTLLKALSATVLREPAAVRAIPFTGVVRACRRASAAVGLPAGTTVLVRRL
ncbi:hypothetical protein [Streptomyces mirabilis]|uniref:hypothetical protein n=1 Tax=Streptomyces mirabilis TaxID=68239 RepID=UPI003710E568